MRTWSVCLVILMLGAGAPAGADGLGDWFDPGDWQGRLGAQEIGGRDKPTAAPAPDEASPSTGDSSRRLKAGALSLLVPGAGQLYNGQRTKGLVMLGVEAVIWGAYLGFDQHADNLGEDSRNWAGVYAGTTGSHEDGFWQDVGRYMDSEAWYDAQLREARAFGEPAPAPPEADEEWQWRSESYRSEYQYLRADANEAYDRRDMMILFAILNRAVAVFDAVRNGGAPQAAREPAVGASLLGGAVGLEVSPAFTRPEARAVARWSF